MKNWIVFIVAVIFLTLPVTLAHCEEGPYRVVVTTTTDCVGEHYDWVCATCTYFRRTCDSEPIKKQLSMPMNPEITGDGSPQWFCDVSTKTSCYWIYDIAYALNHAHEMRLEDQQPVIREPEWSTGTAIDDHRYDYPVRHPSSDHQEIISSETVKPCDRYDANGCEDK